MWVQVPPPALRKPASDGCSRGHYSVAGQNISVNRRWANAHRAVAVEGSSQDDTFGNVLPLPSVDLEGSMATTAAILLSEAKGNTKEGLDGLCGGEIGSDEALGVVAKGKIRRIGRSFILRDHRDPNLRPPPHRALRLHPRIQLRRTQTTTTRRRSQIRTPLPSEIHPTVE